MVVNTRLESVVKPSGVSLTRVRRSRSRLSDRLPAAHGFSRRCEKPD
jgi:hypothetical protein